MSSLPQQLRLLLRGQRTAAAAAAAAPVPPPAWRLSWSLNRGSGSRAAPVWGMSSAHIFSAAEAIKKDWVPSFAFALAGVLEGFGGGGRRSSAPGGERTLRHRDGVGEAAASPSSALTCLGTAATYVRSGSPPSPLVTSWLALLTGELQYLQTRAQAPRQLPPESTLLRDAMTATKQAPGGCMHAARVLAGGVAAFTPNTPLTLRDKHPAGDDAAVLLEAAAAATIAAQARLPALGMAAPRFPAAAVRKEVRRLSPDSSPGPSALRYGYLQQCLSAAGVDDRLAQLLAWLGTQAYAAPTSLPPEFCGLHSAARQFDVGGGDSPYAVTIYTACVGACSPLGSTPVCSRRPGRLAWGPEAALCAWRSWRRWCPRAAACWWLSTAPLLASHCPARLCLGQSQKACRICCRASWPCTGLVARRRCSTGPRSRNLSPPV